MEIFKAIVTFVCAVVDHWATLATGGIVMAAVALWEWRNKRPPRPNVMGVIFISFLVWSVFLAWKDEFDNAERAGVDVKDARESEHYYAKRCNKLSDALQTASVAKKPQADVAETFHAGVDAVVLGQTSGTIDAGAVVVKTEFANALTNSDSLSIGRGAKAGPGSIAIGANAKAGVTDVYETPKPGLVASALRSLNTKTNDIYESTFDLTISNPQIPFSVFTIYSQSAGVLMITNRGLRFSTTFDTGVLSRGFVSVVISSSHEIKESDVKFSIKPQ